MEHILLQGKQPPVQHLTLLRVKNGCLTQDHCTDMGPASRRGKGRPIRMPASISALPRRHTFVCFSVQCLPRQADWGLPTSLLRSQMLQCLLGCTSQIHHTMTVNPGDETRFQHDTGFPESHLTLKSARI